MTSRLTAHQAPMRTSAPPAAAPKLDRFARGFLLASAIVLLAYALPFLIAPKLLGQLVQVEYVGPNAYVEIRAFYGGLELGIALYLLWSAQAAQRAPYALMMFGLVFFPAGAARAWGVLQYGATGPSQPIVAVIEMVGASLALWLARALRAQRA